MPQLGSLECFNDTRSGRNMELDACYGRHARPKTLDQWTTKEMLEIL
jgi:hypothetical protein